MENAQAGLALAAFAGTLVTSARRVFAHGLGQPGRGLQEAGPSQASGSEMTEGLPGAEVLGVCGPPLHVLAASSWAVFCCDGAGRHGSGRDILAIPTWAGRADPSAWALGLACQTPPHRPPHGALERSPRALLCQESR